MIVGERMGFAPSERFDPAYYNDRNPNLGRSCLLAHYVTHGSGRAAGRSASRQRSHVDTSRIDPKRETILVVSHEATRTGAPILAYNIVKRLSPQYNVVTVLLSGGNIVPAFATVSACGHRAAATERTGIRPRWITSSAACCRTFSFRTRW